jgi:hypothetical protein
LVFSVIISQESENKLKIIRQIFENLLPGNRHESPEGSRGLEWLLPSGNKFEKQSGELFSIDSHSRGVFVGLFFHEYKIKNTKKIILSHWIVLRSCSTIDDTYCQIEKCVVTKEKLKQNTNYNYSHLDNVLRLFSL